ncbi:hypothetical protein [Novosphingobium panipatense]|uniref:hypothetical protein n=1 Tax=Novosphingobium panipatense TaxID=428991 RepID=UPI00360EC052
MPGRHLGFGKGTADLMGGAIAFQDSLLPLVIAGQGERLRASDVDLVGGKSVDDLQGESRERQHLVDLDKIIMVAVGDGFLGVALGLQGGKGPDRVGGVHVLALRVLGIADRCGVLPVAQFAAQRRIAAPYLRLDVMDGGSPAALAHDDLIFAVLAGNHDKVLNLPIVGRHAGG